MRFVEDNARSHIHSDVINYLTEEDMNIMSHSPYLSDLASCNYWLNDYIKHNLIDEVNEKSLARNGIQGGEKYSRRRIFDKLLERIELCINDYGDYFEHSIK